MAKDTISDIVTPSGKINPVPFVSFMQDLKASIDSIHVQLADLKSRIDNTDRNVASLTKETETFFRKSEHTVFVTERILPLEKTVNDLINIKNRALGVLIVLGLFAGAVAGWIWDKLTR